MMTASCRISFPVAVAVSLLCLFVSTVVGVPPVPWPPVHKHVEIEFSLAEFGAQQFKQFYYDFPQSSLRVDGSYLAGPEINKLINFTSWWINNTLSIQTFIGNFSTCQRIDMGFGMMVPNWFAFGADVIESGLWLTRQYNKSDSWYYRTQWSRKSAMPDGYFNYFSFNDTGAPFRMSAPSPGGEVLNEYYDFVEVSSFEQGTFSPAPSCQSAKHQVLKVPQWKSMTQFAEAVGVHGRIAGLPATVADTIASHAAQLMLMANVRN